MTRLDPVEYIKPGLFYRFITLEKSNNYLQVNTIHQKKLWALDTILIKSIEIHLAKYVARSIYILKRLKHWRNLIQTFLRRQEANENSKSNL